MIRSLIIGDKVDIDRYSAILEQSKYFGKQQTLVAQEKRLPDTCFNESDFDALFLVSKVDNPYPLFEQAIKTKSNFYFIDQPSLSYNEVESLDKLNLESGNLMYPEVPELEHPLLQDFILTRGSYLMFRYNKSIPHKRKVREAIFSALCFLSLLSPMQVKKIDINSIETSETGHPVFKVRLKLYDSSVAYFVLKFEKNAEHSIQIESQNGSFIFNIEKNYLENIHGVKFKGAPITQEELLQKTIDTFGLHIILNSSNRFGFHHYTLAINPLDKITNFLQNSL